MVNPMEEIADSGYVTCSFLGLERICKTSMKACITWKYFVISVEANNNFYITLFLAQNFLMSRDSIKNEILLQTGST